MELRREVEKNKRLADIKQKLLKAKAELKAELSLNQDLTE